MQLKRKIIVWMCLSINILLTLQQQPLEIKAPTYSIQITQGYNQYINLDRFFHQNYQKVQISELKSEQDNKNYRFCFITQAQKSSLKIFEEQKIFNQSQQIVFDLQSIIQMDKIIDSLFIEQRKQIYLLTTKQIKLIKFNDDKIQTSTQIELNKPINKGKLAKLNDKKFLLMTELKVYIIDINKTDLNFMEILSNQNTSSNFFFTSFNFNQESVGIVSGNDFTFGKLDAFIQKQQQQIFNKQLIGFDGPIQNVFYFLGKSQKTNFLLIKDSQNTFLQFNSVLFNKESFNVKDFRKIEQAYKCKEAYQWQNYLFFQCKTYLLYLNSSQIFKCEQQGQSQINNCFKQLQFRHLNLGYRIQSVEFINSFYILIVGYEKYEIKYIQTDDNKIIQSIIPISTFYTNTSVKNVYLATSNMSVLIHKNSLSIAEEIPQKKELFCKTHLQSNQQLLDQPSGNYNGHLNFSIKCSAIDGIKDQLINQTNKNKLCKIYMPLIVKIKPQVQNYKAIWYCLIAFCCGIVVMSVLYFLYKKRKLNQQYKYTIFQDEKQNQSQEIHRQVNNTQQQNG